MLLAFARHCAGTVLIDPTTMQVSGTTSRVASLFTEPLDDLGDEHPALRGILTPRSARGMKPTGVTAQFLENADEYHRRYANVAHFHALIDDALGRLDPPIEPRIILDIGSGSGNSVIPLLDRFPDAFVVATDISPQLLAILRDHIIARPAYRERIALVCMDASQAPYQRNAFDLAIGAAILHHILEPDRVIDSCEHALRPGGVAVFFEPFEIGHVILDFALREIVAEADRRGEDSAGIAMLRRLHVDYDARRRARANSDALQELDDKWMFSRAFFESFAVHGAWSECRVNAIHNADSPLVDQVRSQLALLEVDADALPDWAWKTLSRYES